MAARLASLLVLVVALLARVPQAAAFDATLLEKELGGARCGRQARELLTRWGSRNEWAPGPPSLDGARVLITPTRRIGFWIQLGIYPDRSLELTRLSSSTRVRARWTRAECQSVLTVRRLSRPRAQRRDGIPALTDAALQGELKRNPLGTLVFAWSPQMPISLKGYREAEAVARQAGLAFLPVMDPLAHAESARKVAKRERFPATALRRMRAIELQARGMNLHYPSVLMFVRGRFREGGPRPGYWDRPEVLANVVKEALK